MGLRLWVVGLSLVVGLGRAFGQCVVDEQCSPPARCVSGQCVTPAPTTPTGSDPGWSRGAAVYGFLSAFAVAGLGIGSELTRTHRDANGKESLVPSLPLGSAAVALHLISEPVVYAGALSTRRQTGVSGSLGLRVTAWILYGGALGAYLFGAAYYAPRGRGPDPGFIAGAITGTAFIGDLLLASDAALVHVQAMRRGSPTARVTPTLTGLAGAF